MSLHLSAPKLLSPKGLLISAIVAVLLISLVSGAWRFAMQTAARNRTAVIHSGVLNALEVFKSQPQIGVYPEPAHPDATMVIDGKTVRIGGAMMLYQLISGDGTSEIMPGGDPAKVSNGRTDDDDPARILVADLPKNEVLVSEGRYLLIDARGHPLQYVPGGKNETVGANFDLWSYGGDAATLGEHRIEIRRDPAATAKWVKEF